MFSFPPGLEDKGTASRQWVQQLAVLPSVGMWGRSAPKAGIREEVASSQGRI